MILEFQKPPTLHCIEINGLLAFHISLNYFLTVYLNHPSGVVIYIFKNLLNKEGNKFIKRQIPIYVTHCHSAHNLLQNRFYHSGGNSDIAEIPILRLKCQKACKSTVLMCCNSTISFSTELKSRIWLN